jgi:hypothetical protein
MRRGLAGSATPCAGGWPTAVRMPASRAKASPTVRSRLVRSGLAAAGTPRAVRRAPCAAAHDQGLPGKRQLLMPERQQNFWKKIASILRH